MCIQHFLIVGTSAGDAKTHHVQLQAAKVRHRSASCKMFRKKEPNVVNCSLFTPPTLQN